MLSLNNTFPNIWATFSVFFNKYFASRELLANAKCDRKYQLTNRNFIHSMVLFTFWIFRSSNFHWCFPFWALRSVGNLNELRYNINRENLQNSSYSINFCGEMGTKICYGSKIDDTKDVFSKLRVWSNLLVFFEYFYPI